MQEESPMVLAYFNFRGMAQPIRTMLAYLQLPYYNVHLDQMKAQKQTLPQSILQDLRAIDIDKSKLPILMHEGRIIYTMFPIMDYLCMRFDREDLLGNNMQQRAIVQQLIELYQNWCDQTMTKMFKIMEKYADVPNEQMMPHLEDYFMKFMNHGYFAKETLMYLAMNPKQPSFILGSITLPDFDFCESTTYMVGAFGSLCPEIANENWREFSKKYKPKPETLRLLRAMKKFNDFFKSQPFYLMHKSKLESYPILGFFANDRQRKSYSKVFNGNKDLL